MVRSKVFARAAPLRDVSTHLRPPPVCCNAIKSLFSSDVTAEKTIVVHQHELPPERDLLGVNQAMGLAHAPRRSTNAQLLAFARPDAPIEEPIDEPKLVHVFEHPIRVKVTRGMRPSSQMFDEGLPLLGIIPISLEVMVVTSKVVAL